MRAAVKCVHPLLLMGAAIFILPFILLPLGLADLLPADKVGPCSIPVFLLFVPSEFMIALGLGLSVIRVFELRAERHKETGDAK
jgi:hypothetical protein